MGVEQTTPDILTPSKTILVVDDEPGILELVKAILASQGYRVLLADSAQRALEIYQEHEATIDLLLTDVMMPVMNGVALAQRLQAMKRDFPVLFMTGGTLGHVGDAELDQRACLRKPFDPSLLISRVKSFLETIVAKRVSV